MFKRRIEMKIDADFGSAMQCKLFMDAVPLALQALKNAAEAQHKKNRIILHITEWEAHDTAVRRDAIHKKLGSQMENSFMELLEDQGVKFKDIGS